MTASEYAAFDYGALAKLFSTADAEVLPAERHRLKRAPPGYGQFARAADAIRFAIEELPAELLSEACLEVGDKTFDRYEIRKLYESDGYPLPRRATIA